LNECKPLVIGFSWDHTFMLLGLFKHMYAGDPAADVDRANRFMADLYAKWTPITVMEWFVFKGLVIAGGLCAQQVRTPANALLPPYKLIHAEASLLSHTHTHPTNEL
jgi:hypothetical protein